jgi:hypothetical protein
MLLLAGKRDNKLMHLVEGIAFHSGVNAFYVLDKPKVPYL